MCRWCRRDRGSIDEVKMHTQERASAPKHFVWERMNKLDEIAGPKTANRKRFFGFLSLLGFGIGLVELGRFLYVRQPIHAAMASIWLAVAIGWGYRYRHFGQSQVERLDIKRPK